MFSTVKSFSSGGSTLSSMAKRRRARGVFDRVASKSPLSPRCLRVRCRREGGTRHETCLLCSRFALMGGAASRCMPGKAGGAASAPGGAATPVALGSAKWEAHLPRLPGEPPHMCVAYALRKRASAHTADAQHAAPMRAQPLPRRRWLGQDVAAGGAAHAAAGAAAAHPAAVDAAARVRPVGQGDAVHRHRPAGRREAARLVGGRAARGGRRGARVRQQARPRALPGPSQRGATSLAFPSLARVC